MSRRKREKSPFDISEFITPHAQDLNAAVHSLLGPRTPVADAEIPARVPEERPPPAASPALEGTIGISRLRALSQTGEQSVFQMRTDALKLVVDLSAAEEWVNSDLRFDADFQLVDLATGLVKASFCSRRLRVAWGREFWISLGNNYGPSPGDYTTPEKWGLDPGMYLFRCLIEFGRTIAYSAGREIPIRIKP